MEELVRLEARRDEAVGEACRQRLDAVYDLPAEERGTAFAVAYGALFGERGIGKPLETILAEFPGLSKLEEVLVFKANNAREEGTELGRNRTRMGIRLRTEWLSDSERLGPFLRHEFMHISDMLDPDFGYRDEPLDQYQERHVPRSYEVLWDTSIDGRLERQGQSPEVIKQQRQVDFERLFSSLPRRQRVAAFHHLWNSPQTTHAGLLELAQDPARLAALAPDGEEVPLAPVSGTFCPLCQFATFDWAEPNDETRPIIQRDFPAWTPEEGICGRCHELYELRVEGERVAS